MVGAIGHSSISNEELGYNHPCAWKTAVCIKGCMKKDARTALDTSDANLSSKFLLFVNKTAPNHCFIVSWA